MEMNPVYHNDVLQNSEEWFQLRCGVLTASVVKQLFTKSLVISKDKKIKTLAYELASQRVTDNVEETFQSYKMERGTIEEDYARDLYNESRPKALATECGFVTSDALGFKLGFSPDGIVNDDGIIEIKSRDQKYQLQTIVENQTPNEYMIQIQTGLLVTGREFCDFISYSNGMQMFTNRVVRNEELIDLIITASTAFEEDVKDLVKAFNRNKINFVKAERREYNRDTDITSSGE